MQKTRVIIKAALIDDFPSILSIENWHKNGLNDLH